MYLYIYGFGAVLGGGYNQGGEVGGHDQSIYLTL